MKTLELKLKKDVLIVEVDKSFNHFKIYDDEIGFIFIENSIPRKELIKGSYKFFCKGSELTEEIASELVEKFKLDFNKEFCVFKDYINDCNRFSKSIPSFISVIESKGFYWLQNTVKYEKTAYEIYADENQLCRYISKQEKLHLEAEEKTFKNPLIFVKK